MNKLAILSVLALFGCASGFQSRQRTTRTVVGFGMKSSSNLFLVKPSDDFPEEESEEYTGSVDWDAEWKKEVSRGERPGRERPGQDFYKSEAEVAAIKATNKAAMKGRELTSSVKNSIPDIRSLSGDWKFWIAILAVVSIGFSILSAPSNIPTTNIPTGLQGDSYYI